MIRMLIIGYVFGLRSERLLCREVQVNFAYRWFCKLGIERKIHSSFSAFLAPVSQEANPTSNGFEVPFHLSDCLEGHETSGLKLPKSKPQTCHTQNPQRCGNYQSCDGETEPVINESCNCRYEK